MHSIDDTNANIYPKLRKSWKIEVFQQRLKLEMKDLKIFTVFDETIYVMLK